MKKNVFLIVIAVLLIFIFSGTYVALYTLNYITHDLYDNEYFGIETYKKGEPFIIHNANPVQSSYEEDLLLYGYYKIVGYYRIS